MMGYILGRLIALLPVVLIVAILVFSVVRLVPGDPAALVAGDGASLVNIEAVRTKLGLDQPTSIQFVTWLAGVARGDLGTSLFSGLPVVRLIGQRIEPTLMLAIATMLFATLLAVPLGTLAAWQAGSRTDHAIMVFSVAALAMPVFLLGYGLSYVFAVSLAWFPVQGYRPLSDGIILCLRSLVLPSATLGLVYLALMTRMTRASVLDVLRRDYIRTAHAKGLSLPRIAFGHALRSAAVPILTTFGSGFALLVGGAVVTESVFGIQGLGRLTIDAVLQRDYPVIQGIILIFSAVYLFLNLTIDLLYPLFDPRVELDSPR